MEIREARPTNYYGFEIQQIDGIWYLFGRNGDDVCFDHPPSDDEIEQFVNETIDSMY